MGAAGGAKRRKVEEPQAVYSIVIKPRASVEVRAEEAAQAERARSELWAAASSGDSEGVARVLRAHGFDPGVVDLPEPLAPAPPAVEGDAPLALACRAGHAEVVRLLLKATGVNVNRVNEVSEEGGTPLTIASESGSAVLVGLLLSDGRVEVNAPRADGCTALFMASQNGHTDVVQHLLAVPGVDVERADFKDRFTPLLIAAYKGRHAAAEALIQADANINARTPKDYTALLIAVDRRDPVLHATLLMHGADASAVHSALLRACLMGAPVAARAALERCRSRGRPLDADARLTPLHVACLLGDEAGVEAALQAAVAERPDGAQRAASALDAGGLGALYYAVELGDLGTARLVLAAMGLPEAAVARAAAAIEEVAPCVSRPFGSSRPGSTASSSGSERPGTAPARQYWKTAAALCCLMDGSVFFKAVLLPFVEDRVYVSCDAAKELLLAYLGSAAAARFFIRNGPAFGALHALSVRGLRGIEERLEGIFRREGLGGALGALGDDVPRRPGGGRQDGEGLLPTFPEIHGYRPTDTFYEDDYIDALQMLSCALDRAFFEKVEAALDGVECKIRHPPIKSRTRMRNKLGDPDDHLYKARPRPAHNIDTMRCAATFADAGSLARGYAALVQAFGAPVRVKNGFRPEFDPSQSYGYRSVMLNLRFDSGLSFEDIFGGGRDGGVAAEWDLVAERQASRETGLAMQRILREWFRHDAVRPERLAMAAEVQLILAPYLQARKESHLLYKVARCSGANALVSDAAGRALVADVREVSELEAATARMQEKVARLVAQQSRLPPPPTGAVSCTTIDLEAEGDDRSPHVTAASVKDFMMGL